MKLLFIDTETGGIDETKNSLLSVALVCWDDGKIVDKVELFIKEDEYNVTPYAMQINNIDLNELREIGLEKSKVVEIINDFIKRNFNEKAVFCGHNVGFDIRFLKALYSKVGVDYYENISYRSVDTASILKFLSIAGKFYGKDINSLDDAINYLGISHEDRHTAMGDTLKTIMVFNSLVDLIK